MRVLEPPAPRAPQAQPWVESIMARLPPEVANNIPQVVINNANLVSGAVSTTGYIALLSAFGCSPAVMFFSMLGSIPALGKLSTLDNHAELTHGDIGDLSIYGRVIEKKYLPYWAEVLDKAKQSISPTREDQVSLNSFGLPVSLVGLVASEYFMAESIATLMLNEMCTSYFNTRVLNSLMHRYLAYHTPTV